MNSSDLRELKRHLEMLLTELLKGKRVPEYRTKTWTATINDLSNRIEDLFLEEPGLKALVPEYLPQVFERALYKASLDTGLPHHNFPKQCPYLLNRSLIRNILSCVSTHLARQIFQARTELPEVGSKRF